MYGIFLITEKGPSFGATPNCCRQPNHQYNINKAKTFKYMSRVTKSRTKDNDRFKIHKLNTMKTKLYIIVQILKCNNH